MTKLLTWLTGGKTLAWIAGIVVLLVLGLAGWLRIEQLQRQAADARAEKAEAARAAAQAETAQRDKQIAALVRQAEAAAATAARIEPIRRSVNAAPRTSACVASPVIRAGFDRLRATRPGGTAPGAADPDRVPAGTGRP